VRLPVPAGEGKILLKPAQSRLDAKLQQKFRGWKSSVAQEAKMLARDHKNTFRFWP
jgi:hypothetical protein